VFRTGKHSNQHNREGKTIGKKRKLVGLTQHSLAVATGIDVQRITYFETGRLLLEPQELDRIRKALKNRAQKAMDAVSA
jgi:transcriptional regulator with XRE-family HTH domain